MSIVPTIIPFLRSEASPQSVLSLYASFGPSHETSRTSTSTADHLSETPSDATIRPPVSTATNLEDTTHIIGISRPTAPGYTDGAEEPYREWNNTQTSKKSLKRAKRKKAVRGVQQANPFATSTDVGPNFFGSPAPPDPLAGPPDTKPTDAVGTSQATAFQFPSVFMFRQPSGDPNTTTTSQPTAPTSASHGMTPAPIPFNIFASKPPPLAATSTDVRRDSFAKTAPPGPFSAAPNVNATDAGGTSQLPPLEFPSSFKIPPPPDTPNVATGSKPAVTADNPVSPPREGLQVVGKLLPGGARLGPPTTPAPPAAASDAEAQTAKGFGSFSNAWASSSSESSTLKPFQCKCFIYIYTEHTRC